MGQCLLRQELYDQIHTGKTAGCAYGRNIYQQTQPEAIALCNAIASIVFDNSTIEQALSLLK